VIVSRRSGVVVEGPLAAFASGFVADLVVRGYRPGSAADQLGMMGMMGDVS